MKHKLKKGETYKVADSTPNYIVATYDSYSLEISYSNLDKKNIDWDNVVDISGYQSQCFITMADGTEHILDYAYEEPSFFNGNTRKKIVANSDEPDLIQVFNDADHLIWEYVY